MKEQIKDFFRWAYKNWFFWIVIIVVTAVSGDFGNEIRQGYVFSAFGYIIGEIVSLTVVYLVFYVLLKIFRKKKKICKKTKQ